MLRQKLIKKHLIVASCWSSLFIFFSSYKNVYQLTCTKQKAPDNSDVHSSLQNCWSSVWNLHYIAMLSPRICRQLPDFRQKWCVCVCPWSRCSLNPPHSLRQYRTTFHHSASQRTLHFCIFGHGMEIKSKYFSDVDVLNAVPTD